MKLVNYDIGVGQDALDGIPVWIPHVHGNIFHIAFAFELRQISGNGRLIQCST